MEKMRLIQRAVLLPVLLATLVAGAMANRSPRYRNNDPPQSALDSDSELLRALEFLDQYERTKSREISPPVVADDFPAQGLPDLYGGFEGSRNFAPYPIPQFGNEIPPVFDDEAPPYMPLKWEDDEDGWSEVDEEDIALEDLLPPRPEDLETNEVAMAEDVLEEYEEYEAKRQKELFDKILGDVMAEKLLQQDEEENIAKLMEEQEDEHQGLEDLADIFGPSTSSASSSEAEVEVYDPKELELPIFSASSDDVDQDQDSQTSESDDVEEVDGIFLSEGGLDALDEAERILKEGYGDGEKSESSESMPDFDGTSGLISLLEDGKDSQSGEGDESLEQQKAETLKDIIYRIVQDNLRRKLVESIVGEDDLELEPSGASVGEETEPIQDEEDDSYDNLLENLVDEIREQVEKLTSRVMKQIEGDAFEKQEEADVSLSQSDSRENDGAQENNSPSDGYFDDEPIGEEPSSSIPEEVIDEIIGEGLSSSGVVKEDEFGPSSSSAFREGEQEEDEESVSDEDLINAIREIVPAVQSRVCPILSYLVDDCSVIEGFKGLGLDGYREAFSRPCNRHQICYTCSTSYEIPTRLCDEIYKAELLTLCSGDPECKQRAKYFWLAATNDRTAPGVNLSLCSDQCVLDYLLSD